MDAALANELWTSSDYRAFLRGWFEARKREQPSFSAAVLGKRLALDASLLRRILQGERHLATSRIQPVCDALGLSGEAAEYFRCLVLHAKSKTAREAQVQFERMQDLRRIAPTPLSDAHRSYWDSWVHVALRGLLVCGDFGDEWDRMGRLLHPPQAGAVVRKAMARLRELGLASKDAHGHWKPAEAFVKDGPGTPARALRNFHRQSLLLAVEALEGLAPTSRHITSSTLSLEEEDYRHLVGMIEDFRSRAMARSSRARNPDRVVQLAVQLVPLAGAHLHGPADSL